MTFIIWMKIKNKEEKYFLNNDLNHSSYYDDFCIVKFLFDVSLLYDTIYCIKMVKSVEVDIDRITNNTKLDTNASATKDSNITTEPTYNGPLAL